MFEGIVVKELDDGSMIATFDINRTAKRKLLKQIMNDSFTVDELMYQKKHCKGRLEDSIIAAWLLRAITEGANAIIAEDEKTNKKNKKSVKVPPKDMEL